MPLYTAMWVRADYTKVNAISTEARLLPGSCSCVRTAFYCVAVIYVIITKTLQLKQATKIEGADRRLELA